MPQLYSEPTRASTPQEPPVPSSPMIPCSFYSSFKDVGNQLDIFILRAFELQKSVFSVRSGYSYINMGKLIQEICQKSQMLRIQLKNIISEMNMIKNHNEEETKNG